MFDSPPVGCRELLLGDFVGAFIPQGVCCVVFGLMPCFNPKKKMNKTRN